MPTEYPHWQQEQGRCCHVALMECINCGHRAVHEFECPAWPQCHRCGENDFQVIRDVPPDDERFEDIENDPEYN